MPGSWKYMISSAQELGERLAEHVNSKRLAHQASHILLLHRPASDRFRTTPLVPDMTYRLQLCYEHPVVYMESRVK
jgi:hypothetical protein